MNVKLYTYLKSVQTFPINRKKAKFLSPYHNIRHSCIFFYTVMSYLCVILELKCIKLTRNGLSYNLTVSTVDKMGQIFIAKNCQLSTNGTLVFLFARNLTGSRKIKQKSLAWAEKIAWSLYLL